MASDNEHPVKDIETYIKQGQTRVNTALAMLMPVNPKLPLPTKVLDAMRYSVFNGGKRLRALLAYASCEASGVNPEMANTAACALEMMHAYSLIHDDLPAMDDADLRRGKPSCHIAFDEATAILAGDGLQAFAIETITQSLALKDTTRLRMVDILVKAVGPSGMVGGQGLDLYAGQHADAIDIEILDTIHAQKTGALLRASLLLGAISSEKTSEHQLQCLDQFALPMGLAFQIRDDILDVESDTDTLGKSQGKDQAQGKITYPSLTSLAFSKQKARKLYHQAELALKPLGTKANRLLQLAQFIIHRHH